MSLGGKVRTQPYERERRLRISLVCSYKLVGLVEVDPTTSIRHSFLSKVLGNSSCLSLAIGLPSGSM